MRQDSRLSRMLHVLLHMEDAPAPLTSEAIAQMLSTNAVVVRRTLGTLREKGYVEATKGHGGGWVLAQPLTQLTLFDVYQAIGEPVLFAMGLSDDKPTCLVEKAVNATLSESLAAAEEKILKQFRETKLSQIAKTFKKDLRKMGHTHK